MTPFSSAPGPYPPSRWSGVSGSWVAQQVLPLTPQEHQWPRPQAQGYAVLKGQEARMRKEQPQGLHSVQRLAQVMS